MKYTFLIIALGLMSACKQSATTSRVDEGISIHQASYSEENSPSITVTDKKAKKAVTKTNRRSTISREELVKYAQMFYGVPYKYGSADPEVGFDCSGYINYVFNHFNIPVPRSSVDFTDAGTTVEVSEASPGDLVLFTGTDSTSRKVGHIGIVIKNDEEGLEFIHSSSGKQASVTINPLQGYYEGRFVKVIRLI